MISTFNEDIEKWEARESVRQQFWINYIELILLYINSVVIQFGLLKLSEHLKSYPVAQVFCVITINQTAKSIRSNFRPLKTLKSTALKRITFDGQGYHAT